jgi:hypothetical protein
MATSTNVEGSGTAAANVTVKISALPGKKFVDGKLGFPGAVMAL